MRWVDIEQSAQAYKDRIQKPELPPEPVIQILSRDQIEAQKQAEVDEIFRRFEVRECLEAIAKDVWGEGEVRKDGTIYTEGYFGTSNLVLDDHLRLVSKEFTEIGVSRSWPENRRRLYIQPRAVGIGVRLNPMPFEHNRWQLRVATHSIYKLADEDLNVEEYLRTHPLDLALRYVFSLDDKRVSEPQKEIEVDQGDALGAFHLALKEQVDMMVESNSLPARIRAWCDQRIQLLPVEWQGLRQIESDQIFDWAYHVKGTPKIIRDLNSRFGYRFPI